MGTAHEHPAPVRDAANAQHQHHDKHAGHSVVMFQRKFLETLLMSLSTIIVAVNAQLLRRVAL